MPPTGLKDSVLGGSILGKGAGLKLQQSEPRPAINISIQLYFLVTNQPIRFPPLTIPKGLSVTLRGVNGAAINANPAYVGNYADQLLGGTTTHNSGRLSISPDTAQSYPCDNLAQIWAMGTAGDGLLASIFAASIG